MSDVRFDADRCRNIMVDIRYVLWVTDIYAGATHLVQEMNLTERDPDNLSPNWRPFGTGTGMGRGYEQDPGRPQGRVPPQVFGAHERAPPTMESEGSNQ